MDCCYLTNQNGDQQLDRAMFMECFFFKVGKMIIDSRSYFLKLSALGKQMASSSSAQVREGLLKCAKWLVTI